MKKWLLVLLALCLLTVGAVGCGGADDDIVNGDDEEEKEEAIDPSEGEPFEGGSFDKMVGSYTIETEWIPFAEPVVVDEIFEAHVAVHEDDYYILTDGKIKLYHLEDGKLVFDEEIPLEDEYRTIDVDDKGTLYASQFMKDFVAFRDGEQIFAHDGPKIAAMHPSGKWGLSYFTGSDAEKMTLSDGTLKMEDWELKEIDMLRRICIGEKYVFACGSSAENENQAVFVYDSKKNLKYTLGDKESGEPDRLGSITAVVQTENGFMALDGNLRNVCFWKPDADFIGTIDAGDVFGTSYPWLSTAALMPDGSVIVGMTEEREDKSAKEFILYRLTGF